MDEPEPTRLIDDPAVDAALREDLSRAAHLELPALDLEAGQARLEAAIRGGGGGGGGGASGGGAAWGAGALAALLAIGAAIGWMAWPEPTASVASTAPANDPRGAGANARATEPTTVHETATRASGEPGSGGVVGEGATTDEAVQADSEADDPEEGASTAPSSTADRTGGPPGRARRRAPHRPPAGSSEPSSLREEMSLLAWARAALPTAPARALTLADEGQRRFPSGIFVEEREAIAIQALAALGRDAAARQRGTRFLLAHPSGPHTDRVRRAIAASEGSP